MSRCSGARRARGGRRTFQVPAKCQFTGGGQLDFVSFRFVSFGLVWLSALAMRHTPTGLRVDKLTHSKKSHTHTHTHTHAHTRTHGVGVARSCHNDTNNGTHDNTDYELDHVYHANDKPNNFQIYVPRSRSLRTSRRRTPGSHQTCTSRCRSSPATPRPSRQNKTKNKKKQQNRPIDNERRPIRFRLRTCTCDVRAMHPHGAV